MLLSATHSVQAEPPVASYIFPAGGQRGKEVAVRVGGLFLHQKCGFEMLGAGVHASSSLMRIPTVWFEGPLLPLPDSQRQEDYPQDLAGQIKIAADATPGPRHWRLWTSQGCTASMPFVVGDLPEIVEQEIDGEPIPVAVQLPLTINGRIFPREDVDLWSFHARKGQTVTCIVHAARLETPLEAHLEIVNAQGRKIVEADEYLGGDPWLSFTAADDGVYQARIRDVRALGGQAFVYRLTITDAPHVAAYFPLGGKAGGRLKLDLMGAGLPAQSIDAELPAKKGSFSYRPTLAGPQANTLMLDVDEHPEYVDSQPPAMAVVLPAIFNGRIARPGEVDRWSIQARKGNVCQFELRAGCFGAPLDGVLTVMDAKNKELARAESSKGRLDAALTFTAPADGVYTVGVQDRFVSRGGPRFVYRLRGTAVTPDFALSMASDALTVPRGGQGKLKLQVDRAAGFKEPIELVFDNLPTGVSFAGKTTLAPNQTNVELVFKADAGAKIRTAHLGIHGEAKVGGDKVSRRASLKGQPGEVEIDRVLLAVALPTPFKIKGVYEMGFAPRGSVQKRHYKIERTGYDGPIEVSLADKQARHLQGVTGPTITVPAGATEFDYPVTMPPWMETGRTCRVCVMGYAILMEDGVDHPVSFSSVNQNEQFVAVVGPGKIAIDVEQTSFLAQPGKNAVCKVRLKRGQDVKGPAKLELVMPAHMKGMSAEAVTIAAEQENAELLLRFAAAPAGPFNMPVTVRATLVHEGRPCTAEEKIEILPESR